MEEMNSTRQIANKTTDRGIGLTMAAVFCVVGLIPILRGYSPRVWAIVLSFVLIFISLTKSSFLSGLNQGWFQFGMLLQKLTTPIMLGFVFFFVMTPMACIMRGFGWDGLRLRWNPESKSYWILRSRDKNESSSFLNQF